MRGDITGIMTGDMAEHTTVLELAASFFVYKLRRDLKMQQFFFMLQHNKKVNKIRQM
jgi:hypothetical protein